MKSNLKMDCQPKKRIIKKKLRLVVEPAVTNSSSSSNSEEGSNTISPSSSSTPKQISPSIHWNAVLNNWTVEERSSIVLKFQELCDIYIVSEEIAPTTGTPHLQMYVKFKEKCRPISHNINPRISWSKVSNKPNQKRSTKEMVLNAVTYCRKSGKVFDEFNCPHETRDYNEVIECVDLAVDGYPWQKKVIDLYHTTPNHRNIYWFWSQEGLTGKTELVRYLAHKYNIPFSYGGSVSDIMNLAFNNMAESKCFIFALTRKKKNHISYDALEQLKDGLISNNKFETGCRIINRPHVFVFANKPPDDDEDEEFMSKDRFIVEEIGA